MPLTLIQQKPDFVKKVEGDRKLSISELFSNTIQGEGVSVGVPATFLRLEGCTLLCSWCDTLDVWNKGNEYTFDEIFTMFEEHNLIDKFLKGQRLVLTGGSPLKQQEQLVNFIRAFQDKYFFKPFIEVENEVVLDPTIEFIELVDQWNNSPKLANSGMKERVRYKPELIKRIANLPNSWFKFVVDCEEDWQEINQFFLAPDLISRSQVIVMPKGMTKEELGLTREITVDMAIKYNVRFSDREHINIWNKKTGV
jgi:organic radical activating enzyme